MTKGKQVISGSKESVGTVDTERVDDEGDRGQWGSKAEFILSCVGLSVGLGNVWRFPVLAYENGGAAFLIPYIILQLLIGKPMYFMELAMGQFSNLGPTGVWKMNPMAKGIGVSMALISIIVAIYYNVIMAYTLYYFFATMQTTLPWTTCPDNTWLDRGCVTRKSDTVMGDVKPGLMGCRENFTDVYHLCICDKNDISLNYNRSDGCFFEIYYVYKEMEYDADKHNDSVLTVYEKDGKQMVNASVPMANTTCDKWCVQRRTAAEIYFYDEVIKRSDTIENTGTPIWYLALCLMLSWIVVVLCLIKGVKSSGKVVYFTATFPYVILLVLLIRGALLPGAGEGVLYFLVPKWSKLLELDVWRNAASQMFFSLSVSFGGIIMFGSYNKFKNNVYTDALFISVMDIVTSIIAGFVIFTTLGNMSQELGIPIEEVAQKGYGLAFVAYPEALSRLPVPHLWSLLFFFMLFTLGLDSEFALLETALTCLQDEIPKLRKYKWLLCVASGAVFYLLALPCTTPAGDYVVTLMDTYGASFSVLFVAASEMIAIMWVYRVNRFMNDVKYMLGYAPHPEPYWIFCWVFAAPVLILLLLGYTFAQHSPPTYPDESQFSTSAQVIGWLIAAVVMLPIPVWAIVKTVMAGGNPCKASRPTSDWGPACGSGSTDALDAHPMYAQSNGASKGKENLAFDRY
ncbi:sodium-dependent proline transporter-like isoform X2 [Liolophura sinensis]|uniref:sodium-dependent proline transporter-like isoform X2 n=1 Tax=Liolophura sinensis TaxID=3198878 RepID=UPI003159921F